MINRCIKNDFERKQRVNSISKDIRSFICSIPLVIKNIFSGNFCQKFYKNVITSLN
jgi:hypothetical protein